jgi:hypothetical protein
MATRRNPVKPLSQTAEQVARAAAADKARKVASKKALRAHLNEVADSDADESEVITQAEAVVQSLADTLNTVHAANLAAAREEAQVLGVSFEAACESMGIDPSTGHPTVTDTAPILGYSGPMLALRERSKAGHYVKGTNGNPHCGDAVADALQVLTRERVVQVCIKLLNLEGNPYLHLNPGQQSMNLRNKLRHAVKNGFVSADAVRKTAEHWSTVGPAFKVV